MWTKFCDMENILQKNVSTEVMKVSKKKFIFYKIGSPIYCALILLYYQQSDMFHCYGIDAQGSSQFDVEKTPWASPIWT
jgi:hypothetical protein